MKKTYKEMLMDVLTKTFDQRYEEMSRGNRAVHWICVAATAAMIALMFIFGN